MLVEVMTLSACLIFFIISRNQNMNVKILKGKKLKVQL